MVRALDPCCNVVLSAELIASPHQINAFCSRPVPVESGIPAAVHEHPDIEVNWRAPRGDGFDQARRNEGQPDEPGHIASPESFAARDLDE
jgi:hypothetical protein